MDALTEAFQNALIYGLIALVAFYALVPLLIRFQQKFPARPELRELDLHDLDRSLAKFLRTRTEVLLDLGFAEVRGDGTVADGLEDKARLAVDNCPEYAIAIVEE